MCLILVIGKYVDESPAFTGRAWTLTSFSGDMVHTIFKYSTAISTIVVVLVAISLVRCSFMPEELKAFIALPLPEVNTGYYENEGVTISYVHSGKPSGHAVVFVHGSPGSWEDWKLIIARSRLKERFHMIAVNRPGWGENAASSQVVPQISEQSRMLRKALDIGSNGEKVILVGHSLGGPVVLKMAMDYPRRVGAVVLLAPSLDPDLDAVLWYNKLADYKLVKFFLPSPLVKSNDEILALPNALRDLEKGLASIDQPVVVVHGKKDQLVHPGNADYAREKLVNAPFHERRLPNFGHLIPHLRPAEVVIAIEEAALLIDKLHQAEPVEGHLSTLRPLQASP